MVRERLKRCVGTECAKIIGREMRTCPFCKAEQPLVKPAVVGKVQTPVVTPEPVEAPVGGMTKLPAGLGSLEALEAALRTMAMQMEYVIAQLKLMSDVIEIMKKERADAGDQLREEEDTRGASSVVAAGTVPASEQGLSRHGDNQDDGRSHDSVDDRVKQDSPGQVLGPKSG